MSLPLNGFSPLIYINDTRSSSSSLTYDSNGLVTSIDYFVNSSTASGTTTQSITYGTTNNVVSIASYWNGVIYQTETFTYGTGFNIISSTIS